MKVRVQSIHFNADRKLLSFIQKRADKLDQFYEKIIKGDVYLRLQNVNDDLNKVVEIKLSLPDSQLFVKKQCRSFEEATDLAVESLYKQINKYKYKSNGNLGPHKEVLAEAFE